MTHPAANAGPDDLCVIVPTFNRSHELKRALDSLVAQTDDGFEVIVCDDGSSEDIADAVRPYRDRLRLKLIRMENSGGPARPRNAGLAATGATWVSYLDSDDWWYPSRMSRVKASLRSDIDVLYHQLQVHRADGSASGTHPEGATLGEPMRGKSPLLHMIRVSNPIPTSAVTVRRARMQDIGGFNESRALASVEDFDAWLRLAAGGARFALLPEVLGAYWVGTDNISAFTARQFERQKNLFERQLRILPEAYTACARSNFNYLLGGYALMLGQADAREYFSQIDFALEPKRWIKSRAKLLSHALAPGASKR